MKKVNLETSIFSFYHDERPQPEIIARRNWSRRLIDELRTEYFMVASPAVLTELSRGNKPHKDQARTLALSFPELEINQQIKEMVAVYLQHLVTLCTSRWPRFTTAITLSRGIALTLPTPTNLDTLNMSTIFSMCRRPLC